MFTTAERFVTGDDWLVTLEWPWVLHIAFTQTYYGQDEPLPECNIEQTKAILFSLN
jgi:hypothetical protein